MSDVPPPPPPPGVPPEVPPELPPEPPTGASEPGPDSPPPDGASVAKPSLWARYRALPLWVQILIPVVIIGIVIGIWALLASSDDDESSSSDSTVAEGSSMDDILRGIILVGGIRGEDATTTTTEAATTTAAATTTTEPTTTTTTTPPSTTVAATAAPPATAPPTTSAPTTDEPTTTEEATATTEEAPATTEAPAALPSPDDFLAQWNSASEGTDVPTISRSQITQIVDGPFTGAFLATLSPTSGEDMPPQVGLIGTMSTTDPTQIAELLLVYVSGPDESASDFFWESFGVLTQAVSPGTTNAQIAALENSLGRADGMPPFPEGTDNTAESDGFNYNLHTGTTQDGTAATGIAVT